MSLDIDNLSSEEMSIEKQNAYILWRHFVYMVSNACTMHTFSVFIAYTLYTFWSSGKEQEKYNWINQERNRIMKFTVNIRETHSHILSFLSCLQNAYILWRHFVYMVDCLGEDIVLRDDFLEQFLEVVEKNKKSIIESIKKGIELWNAQSFSFLYYKTLFLNLQGCFFSCTSISSLSCLASSNSFSLIIMLIYRI